MVVTTMGGFVGENECLPGKTILLGHLIKAYVYQ